MNILVAVDGSPPSQDAIDEITRRPWPKPSTVRVLSVVRPYVPSAAEFVPLAATPDDITQQHLRDAERLARQAADQISRAGVSVEAMARQGDARSVIVDEAADWPADLIVMGSHGRSGLKRLLLGSVAQAVVAHAPCSVEVVRRRATS
ncbi:MAG TPA: universal stress protein [Vicinamibacterales bacterium]|nr:universal stress protein [Vicinamibacterales bacterium]